MQKFSPSTLSSGSQSLIGLCWLGVAAVALPVFAQAPPRAGIVQEDLRADAGRDYFQRGKNIFDDAQRSVDLQTRRELYLRAADIFSGYINEFPAHPNAEAAWWYMGSSYYQAGMIDDAKRCFSTLLNRFGQGKYAAAAAYTLAADHYNKREYAFAAPLFERFAANAARAEDKPKGNLFAGNCYRLLGRDREAIAAYKRVIADPAGALFRDQAQLAIAHISFKSGKLQEALDAFAAVANSNAPAKYRGEGALHAAITATKLGETELAEKYLRFILFNRGMEEYRPDAQTALMENYYARKEYREVIDLFRKSTLKAEGEKEAMRLMIAARAMMKLDQPAEASELFREIERMVPPENDLAFQASYYRLNCFFKIEGRHVVDQVDAFIQIYGKIHPNDTRIHTAMLMKAETLFAENKVADAAKVYSKIDPTLLSDSNRPGFLYQRGWCLAEAADPQGAIRSLSEFISKYPEDKRVYPALVKRAKAFAEIGEPAKAIADFDKLTMDKAAPEDLASLAWLESARTRRKEGNIENMVIRYKGLLEKVDDLTNNLKAEANYWIGWGMVKSNSPKEAAPFLNKARELRSEAYGKHAGLLLALSYYAGQDPKNLAAEIELAIKGEYVSDIPNQALQWSGMQSYNSGDYDSAARFLEVIANEEEPRTTPKEVWRYLAKALIETGKAADALPAIANVLEVEDSPAWKADALLDRSRALFALKRYGESRKAADEALALRPQGRTSAGLRIVSADLFVQEEKLGEAAADYLYVIQFHDDADLKPLAIYKYIGVLEKQGKADEAAKFKNQLASEFPNWKAPAS
ncbi:tetratricopeptide repeat protein [Luteolibacter algae]|uniref:Tetratricopeptide repeat protein n=1 Tax=Luteolibacter algae TaxID=454151 RepID=A0ABW5D4Q1_9BACT